MTDDFTPVTLKNAAGRTVTAHTPADLVAAKFDGFKPVDADAKTVAKHEEQKVEEPASVEPVVDPSEPDLGSTGSRTTRSGFGSGR